MRQVSEKPNTNREELLDGWNVYSVKECMEIRNNLRNKLTKENLESIPIIPPPPIFEQAKTVAYR